MNLFSGKVILITGGTSGIGRATAVAFGEEGSSVVVSGRREKEGEESVKLVEKAGGKCLFVKADVAIEEQIADLVRRTVEEFGRLISRSTMPGLHWMPVSGLEILRRSLIAL